MFVPFWVLLVPRSVFADLIQDAELCDYYHDTERTYCGHDTVPLDSLYDTR